MTIPIDTDTRSRLHTISELTDHLAWMSNLHSIPTYLRQAPDDNWSADLWRFAVYIQHRSYDTATMLRLLRLTVHPELIDSPPHEVMRVFDLHQTVLSLDGSAREIAGALVEDGFPGGPEQLLEVTTLLLMLPDAKA